MYVSLKLLSNFLTIGFVKSFFFMCVLYIIVIFLLLKQFKENVNCSTFHFMFGKKLINERFICSVEAELQYNMRKCLSKCNLKKHIKNMTEPRSSDSV